MYYNKWHSVKKQCIDFWKENNIDINEIDLYQEEDG